MQQSSNVVKGKGVAFSVASKTGEALVIINEISKKSKDGFDAQATFESMQKALFNKHHVSASVIMLVRPGEIPRTRNGKLQRNLAQKLFLKGEFKELAKWQDDKNTLIVDRSDAPNDSIEEPTVSVVPLNLQAEDTQVLRENIITWMATSIANQVSMDASEIDPDMHFGFYGLDSVSAVHILVEFEKFFDDVEFSETLLWDYPNLNALTDYLMESSAIEKFIVKS